MAKRTAFFITLALLFAVSALRAETFGAVLTGSQEVPPRDTAGYGVATVTLDAARTSLTVDMFVTGLTTPISDTHIHGEGGRDVAVGVVLGLDPPKGGTGFRLNKTFPIGKALGDAIATKPHLHYVNVHTSQFPGGEVRGQLVPIDTVMTFAGDLRGAREVPPVTTTATGAFVITLDPNNMLTWEVNTVGLQNANAAHIHRGPAGVSGDVEIGFAGSASDFIDGKRLRGSSPIPAALADAIRANPAGFYVNVHTAANPAGEIRGQLAPANEHNLGVVGRVSNNVDLFVTDVRIFNPWFMNSAGALVEFFGGAAAKTGATGSVAVDIPPRGTAVLDDITGTSLLNAPGVLGGVRITSSSPVAVTARIFNDKRVSFQGTIGQFVPSIRKANLLRSGALPQLSTSGFRTNLGFFNPNPALVDVRLELRAADGTVIGSRVFTLEALSHQQTSIANFITGVELSNRVAMTLTFDSSAPIVAYASVIDNTSDDQIFVVAQDDPGVPVP